MCLGIADLESLNDDPEIDMLRDAVVLTEEADASKPDAPIEVAREAVEDDVRSDATDPSFGGTGGTGWCPASLSSGRGGRASGLLQYELLLIFVSAVRFGSTSLAIAGMGAGISGLDIILLGRGALKSCTLVPLMRGS